MAAEQPTTWAAYYGLERRPLSARAAAASMDLLMVAIVSAIGLLMARHTGASTGFPKGYAAWGQLSLLAIVHRSWPHLLWNASWYGGTPLFPGAVPPLYVVLVTVLEHLTGARAPSVVTALAGVCTVVVGISVYATVVLLGRHRVVALAAGLFALSVPALWAPALHGGLYPRLLALSFVGLAIVAAARFVLQPTKGWLVVATCCSACALSANLAAGAVGCLVVVALVATLPRRGASARAAFSVLVVGGTALLTAFYLLPHFFGPSTTYRSPSAPLGAHASAPPLGLLVKTTTPSTGVVGLGPMLLGLLLVCSGLTFHFLRRPRRLSGLPPEATTLEPFRQRRSAVKLPVLAAGIVGIAGAVAVAYAYAGMVLHGTNSLSGLMPADALCLVALCWPIAIGLLTAALLRLWAPRGVAALIPPMAVIVAGAALVAVLPTLTGGAINLDTANQQALQAIVPTTHGTTTERIAGVADSTTEWLSAATATPQNRGYLERAIVDPSAQAAMEQALRDPRTPVAVRRFIIDWYGIGWLYSPAGARGQAPYRADTATFTPLAEVPSQAVATFAVRHPTPILATTKARTILVVGNHQDTSEVFADLALAGAGTERFVPIEAGRDLDRLTLATLEQFDAVMLYGATTSEPRTTATMLARYVRGGGGLLVDADGDATLLNHLAAANHALIPVLTFKQQPATGSWQLTPTLDPLNVGINFARFSPVYFAGADAWQTITAQGLLQPATKVLTSFYGNVVVRSHLGAGKVLLSGLNLPFHAATFGNALEASYLVRMLGEVARAEDSVGPQLVGSITSDRAGIRLGHGTHTVLFLSHDDPSWQATLDGHPVRIWPAGPSMMLVVAYGEGMVHFEQRLGATAVLGVSLSAIAAALALVLLVLPLRLYRWVVRTIGTSRAARRLRAYLVRRRLVLEMDSTSPNGGIELLER